MSFLGRLFGHREEPHPDPLGTGLWRQVNDRFTRAVDRFYGAAVALHESGGDSPASMLVAEQTHRLNGLCDRVRELCADCQARYPTNEATLTGEAKRTLGDVPRLLSRAATQVATAAQAATMARTAAPAGQDPQVPARSAVTYVDAAEELIGEACAQQQREHG